jgi:hypothetical protein
MSIGDRITGLVPAIGVILATIALVGYLVAGVMALSKGPMQSLFLKNPAANIGIPCSALAAFVLVYTLWKVFPPEKSDHLSLKVFSLEFTGPSGPIGLWVT